MALGYRKLWLGLGAAFVALVIYLSLSTQTIDAGRIEDVKTGHFLAYFWLMYWYSQVYRGRAARFAIAAGLVAMGIGLEYLQGMTTYRTFAYSDMRDNAIGVAPAWRWDGAWAAPCWRGWRPFTTAPAGLANNGDGKPSFSCAPARSGTRD